VEIILSGTGSDGAVGVTRVKEHGGAILVQDPEEAEWNGMPRNAIATGLVDFVLPVATMPETLAAYWRRAGELDLPDAEGAGAADDEAALREVLAVLRARTNHDFSQYKRPTLLRRIGRRMQVLDVRDMPAYLEALRSQPEEVQALLQDVLISVTNFFRDRAAWTALEAIIPLLFQDKGPGDQVRVWVTACATGEEAYTVAMLLLEHARTLDQPPMVQVFATDIDDDAIRRARQGSYPETIVADVAPERLRQFFVLAQGRYRVKQELRDRVLFAHHNILRDPPFSQLDLITCRNLLIYLNRQAQEQVIRLFHFSLRPAGYLLLGSSESLDGVPGLFDIVAKSQRLFKQRANPAAPPRMAGGGTAALSGLRRGARPPRGADRDTLEELHQRLILAHASPSMIVNADYEIVHLSPGAGRFLELEAGEPSTNLLRAAHPDLRLELQTALFALRAPTGQHGQRSESLRVRFGDTVRLVDLAVEPVEDGDYLFVRFADRGAATEAGADTAPATDALAQELQAELVRTRERLLFTVEAYETAGEEYKAANEELTAINEELRAASEELETSKEELQAVNEELATVNQELKHRVEETTQANNDLQNLIAATQIGTLFLDRELRLTRYTPSIVGIFNLIPTDLQRPLAHITHTLQYEHLAADAREVLATLQNIEREVASQTGQWYLARLRAYHTPDGRIAGVVITLVDITERKRTEAALAERARLLDLSNDAIIMRNVDNRIIYWNHGATDLYGWTREEALGQDQHSLLRTEFETPLEQLIIMLQEHDRMEGEVTQVTRDGRRVTLASRWALDRDPEGRPGAILTTYNDITERKRAEAERERLLQEAEQARRAAEAAVQVRDQFLSIASHELRTPLTSLVGYTSMLQARLAGESSADALSQRHLSTIARQADRLNMMIGHLLDVSRLQGGQFTLVRQPLDLAGLVAHVVEDFRLTLPEGGPHTVTVAGPDEPAEVLGDPARLEEVVHNLLSNAVKYSPAGGTVTVRVAVEANEVALEVADQGIGIPAEAQARLFEAFYRAGNVSPQSSGFGIGLYVVEEIVRRHGGRITVESREGAGSRFRVVLPRHERRA
jgi:two-component system CheB/CheR fusion protein